MATSQLTDERLRNWLDGNQTQRERMCLALLSINRKYSNIKPRRPRGGPDHGRDIEALYEEQYETWGAVGFRNAAKDSAADKKWVKTKFLNDLKSALSEKPSLKSFVFFTNVDLTPSEETTFLSAAKEKGLFHVEIFHRERIRILLDSPEGLGLRFQYLNIPLSDAEQAAFFERFGSQLESLLLEGFDDINRKLYRIEFLHDCSKPLHSLEVHLELQRVYKYTDIGYFRFLADITNNREPSYSKLIIGCQSWPPKSKKHLPAYSGMIYFTYSSEPFEQLYGASQIFNSEGESQLRLVTDLWKSIPFAKLGDIDNLDLNIYTTDSLFDKIKTITVVANDYIIAQASAENLALIPRDQIEEEYGTNLFWPDDLYESEEKLPSLMVVLKDVTPTPYFHFYPHVREPFAFWSLNFSRYTPRKTNEAAKNR